MSNCSTSQNKEIILMMEQAAKLLALVILLILSAAAVGANVDQVTPLDNSHLPNQTVPFEYYTDFNATKCNLVVDSITINTANDIPEGFSTIIGTISTGTHNWKISCESANATQESSLRQITIDTNAPTIVLLTPLIGQELATNAANLSFVTLDDQSSELNCSLEIDGTLAYTTIAQSSQPTSMSTNLADGNHSWQARCSDKAGNQKASEIRQFSIKTAIPPPEFGLSISRNLFNTGENGVIAVAAPIGASARVEVCPDTTGFVSCTIAISAPNSTVYPLESSIPYLTKEGKYIVEAYFTYGNYSATKIERYNVTSNIVINVAGEDKVRKNDNYTLEAKPSGGIGDLNATWTLSNGSKYDLRKISIKHTAAGNYTHKITVSDQFNNTRNRNITIEVEDAVTLKIIAKDAENGALIKEATVRLDSQSRDTDSNGEAILFVRTGKRELTIMATNYSIYQADRNITSDETITILLNRSIKIISKPNITLTFPPNDYSLLNTATEAGFMVSSKEDTNCSLYIAEEKNSGFFVYLASTVVKGGDSGEKRFEVIELENMTYYWKIECIDKLKQSVVSETRSIKVGNKPQPQYSSAEIASISAKEKELEALLADFGNLPKSIKDIATAIGVDTDLEARIKQMKNAIRDLDSLNFQSLTPEQAKSEKDRIVAAAQTARDQAPAQLELISSDNFVQYIKNEELEELAKEYLKIKYGDNNTISIKRLMPWLEELQQEAVISTKSGTLRITYSDGTSTEVTAVIRDVKAYNITPGAMIVEVVPKSIAQTAKEIISKASYITIKDDPIIGFPISKDTTIVYYFEKKISPDQIKEIKTAVLADLDGLDPEYVTGFSISSLGIGNGKNILLPLLGIIVLAGLIVGGVRYEGAKALQYASYLVRKGDTLHYINVIMNDITDNIQTGNIDRAVQLYNEAKLAYAELPTMAKNDVFDSVTSLAAKIQDYQARLDGNSRMSRLNELLISAERGLEENNIMAVIADYKAIEAMYHELDEANKQIIHPHVMDLGTKIQVAIASNTRQPLE